MAACTQGHTALVAVLLEHHADVEAVDHVKSCPVCLSLLEVVWGSDDVVDVLMKYTPVKQKHIFFFSEQVDSVNESSRQGTHRYCESVA